MKKNKNILLINAYQGPYQMAHHIPLGLLSIGTLLHENGYEAKILNASEFLANCADILKEEWLYAGISVMTPQIAVALEITRIIKNLKSNTKIAWGGVHPTLFPEKTISNNLIDIIVIGEGEYTCLELSQALENGLCLSGVRGISYKSSGRIIKNEDRPASDIGREPFLDYGLLDVSKIIYSDFSSWGGPENIRALSIITGRGCPYQCTFCVNTAVLKKKFRYKEADRILDEIESLIDRYKIECVRFQDEEFFVSKKRLLDFLDGLEKRKIKILWIADVRANHFIDGYITPELARRIRALGCFYWTLGVESASVRILKKIKKNITLEQVLRASRISSDAGINIGFGFMIGIPGETKKDVTDTVRFAYKLKNKTTYELIFSIFRSYPGSELYAEAVSLGMKEINTLEEWERQDFYETKFQSLDSYPWVKDKDFIRLVKFTTNNVFANYKRAYEWLMWTRVLKLIGIARIKLNFWGLPLEYILFNFAKKITGRGKKRKEQFVRAAVVPQKWQPQEIQYDLSKE